MYQIRPKTWVLKHKKYSNGEEYEIVNLVPYKLVKYITPKNMFQSVYAFLSHLKDINIPNKQTDVEKLTSHGFDKRISFRHRK